MIRIVTVAALTMSAALPAFACDWHDAMGTAPPTTVAAQPSMPGACPTCVAPNSTAVPATTPPAAPQKPS